MTALLAILWFLWLVVSWVLVFEFVGAAALVNMFPEGRKWWLFPAQVISLLSFAACVHFHPF